MTIHHNQRTTKENKTVVEYFYQHPVPLSYNYVCPVLLLKKTVVTDQSDGRQIQKTFTVLQFLILCLVEVYVNIMFYRMAIKKSIMY